MEGDYLITTERSGLKDGMRNKEAPKKAMGNDGEVNKEEYL